MKLKIVFNFLFLLSSQALLFAQSTDNLKINSKGYFERQGVNVIVFDDFYPEGHQGGITIIQNGTRMTNNGDIRLSASPGQWQPIPNVGKKKVDKENQTISIDLCYPDWSRDSKNPKTKDGNSINYPDLKFCYDINVKAEGKSVRVTVDLDRPLPEEWIGKVGFNFELFPGEYFGRSYKMDNNIGIFPKQPNGPMFLGPDNTYEIEPMASGKKFIASPEREGFKLTIESKKSDLVLLDGRGEHNNGWFIVRSLVPSGATKSAIEWVIIPDALPNFIYTPVIQFSQVGYHPNQKKVAIIELDQNDKEIKAPILWKFDDEGNKVKVISDEVKSCKDFLRYKYLSFDFSEIIEKGLYQISYGDVKSEVFQISPDVYKRNVWQPVVEYFLPVQMCHMRVNEKYRVWHDFCHMDDGTMAMTDTIHFDSYRQGSSTLTKYNYPDHVPGLNIGGWHDAGDYDLRVESQGGTVKMLSLAYELFKPEIDETAIDQLTRVVEIHQPDGKSDILQQIEHGALSIVGGYKSLGRFYNGIICHNLRQYVMLGDASSMTDNLIYDPLLAPDEKNGTHSGKNDDRWVWTDENTWNEVAGAVGLASAARVLKGYNDTLANDCLEIAEEYFDKQAQKEPRSLLELAVELYLTTSNKKYSDIIINNKKQIIKSIGYSGWVVSRVYDKLDDEEFKTEFKEAISKHHKKIFDEHNKTPYGVPYKPHIWGAGWGIQSFGVKQYFIHRTFPDIFGKEYMLNALNFVLGCHPGENNSSFASGIGAKSLDVAYGVNRADWSYIPGGVGSGTNLIRPDLPELKVWPFFWQQAEYVIGGGSTDFMFLVLAADNVLNK